MFGKYFGSKGGYNNQMKVVNKKLESLETEINELHAIIVTMQNSLQQAQTLIKYLSTTQIELTKDMSKIYRSLQAVVSSMSKPSHVMNFPVLGRDDDDDDLLN